MTYFRWFVKFSHSMLRGWFCPLPYLMEFEKKVELVSGFLVSSDYDTIVADLISAV